SCSGFMISCSQHIDYPIPNLRVIDIKCPITMFKTKRDTAEGVSYLPKLTGLQSGLLGSFSRPSALRCCINAEVIQLFARFQCCSEPSGFQATPRPCLSRVFRVAVLRGYFATRRTTPFSPSLVPKAAQPAELVLNHPSLLSDFGAQGCLNLLFQF